MCTLRWHRCWLLRSSSNSIDLIKRWKNKYHCHLMVKFWVISCNYVSFYHCKLLCTLRWHRYPQPLFVPFSSSVDSCVVAVTLLTWLRDGKTNKKTFCGRLFHFMIPVTLVKAPREKTKMKTTTSSSSIKKKPIMCWFLENEFSHVHC